MWHITAIVVCKLGIFLLLKVIPRFSSNNKHPLPLNKILPLFSLPLITILLIMTGRSNGMGIEERRTRLNSLVQGWMNYFKLADAKILLQGLDEWIRRRIRMVTWKRWKRIRTRFENLKRAGLDRKRAWMWANTRKGYWRVANSPILKRAIPNDLIKRAGYLSLMKCYTAT